MITHSARVPRIGTSPALCRLSTSFSCDAPPSDCLSRLRFFANRDSSVFIGWSFDKMRYVDFKMFGFSGGGGSSCGMCGSYRYPLLSRQMRAYSMHASWKLNPVVTSDENAARLDRQNAGTWNRLNSPNDDGEWELNDILSEQSKLIR